MRKVCVGAVMFIVCVVRCTVINIGIDDSMLNTTISIDRGKIKTEALTGNVIDPVGTKVDRTGAHAEGTKDAVYFAVSLITDTKEEIEQRYAFIAVQNSGNERRVLKYNTLYTEVPEQYVYGQHIARKIRGAKIEVKKEVIRTVYITARGYTTSKQKDTIGEAVKSGMIGAEVKVIPDGTALALEHIAPGEESKMVQCYVFRGKKVSVSLYRYKKRAEQRKSAGEYKGTLTCMYHDSYDVYNEDRVLEIVSAYVHGKVKEIVEERKRKDTEAKNSGVEGEKEIETVTVIECYPCIEKSVEKSVKDGNESVESAEEERDKSRQKRQYYNIVPLINQAISVLNNEYRTAEHMCIECSEIVLENEKGQRETVLPEEGVANHRISIAKLNMQILEYIQEKTEGIQEMIKQAREKAQEYVKKSKKSNKSKKKDKNTKEKGKDGKDDKDDNSEKEKSNESEEEYVQELVYNDMMMPHVFKYISKMCNFGLSDKAEYMNKMNLSEGGPHASHWGIEIQDSGVRTGRSIGENYTINGKTQKCSAMPELLKQEQEIEVRITNMLVDTLDKEEEKAMFDGFSDEEASKIKKQIAETYGQDMTMEEYRKSKEIVHAIEMYTRKKEEVDERKAIQKGTEEELDRIKKRIEQMEEMHKETSKTLPEETKWQKKVVKQKRAEIEAIMNVSIERKSKEQLRRIRESLDYHIDRMKKKENEHILKMMEEAEQKAEAEKQEEKIDTEKVEEEQTEHVEKAETEKVEQTETETEKTEQVEIEHGETGQTEQEQTTEATKTTDALFNVDL